MIKIFSKALIFIIGFLLFTGVPVRGEIMKVKSDGTLVSAEIPETKDAVSVDPSLSLSKSHLAWGAEIGSSIDLTSHDLSTFDADFMLGYRNDLIKLAGIGCGFHRSIHSTNNFVPLYGILRTSFRREPSLLFMNLQAGYSFNTISDHGTVGDFTSSLGFGINLQQRKSYQTYFIFSLAYQYYSDSNKLKIEQIDTNYIFFARLVFGVNF